MKKNLNQSNSYLALQGIGAWRRPQVNLLCDIVFPP